jgi:hypothetical protein
MRDDELNRRLEELQRCDTEKEKDRESRRWFIKKLAATGLGGVLLPTLFPSVVDARMVNCGGGVHTCNPNECSPNECTSNTCTSKNECKTKNDCGTNTCESLNDCKAHNECDVNSCSHNLCVEDEAIGCSKEQPNTCQTDECTTSDTQNCGWQSGDTCYVKNILPPD